MAVQQARPLVDFLQQAVLATQTAENLPATQLAAAAGDMPTGAWGAAAGPGTKIVYSHRSMLGFCLKTGMHCPLACYASLLPFKQTPGGFNVSKSVA